MSKRARDNKEFENTVEASEGTKKKSKSKSNNDEKADENIAGGMDENDEKFVAGRLYQQTAEQRRQVRTQYRDQLQFLDDNKLEALKPESSIIADILQRAQSSFRNVTTTQEALLDAKVFLQVGALSVQRARNLQIGGGFNVADFAAKLLKKLGNDEIDDEGGPTERRLKWANLASVAFKYSRWAPTPTFLSGPLYFEPKVRVPKERAKNLSKGDKVVQRPQELRQADIQQQESGVTAMIMQMYKRLRQVTTLDGVERYPLFKFITNPHSFSQSVENLYHFSFLIKECKVAYEEEQGELWCATREPATEEQHRSGEVKRAQSVITFDMEDWKDAIEIYSIDESVLPNRKAIDHDIAHDKWVG